MQVVLNPKYQYLRPWIEALPERFGYEGKVIYDARNQIRVIPADGLMLNVKRFCVPIWINRFVYKTFRKPKAVRAYENARVLQENGIATPEPIAYILTYKRGLLAESYLITVQIAFSRMFYEFGEHPLAGSEDIIKNFVHFTARMHELGIYHKDFSPGNILFGQVNGEWQFSVVDINRMKFGKIDIKKGCAAFARLWGNVAMMKLIAREYAADRHFDASLCEQLILKYWREFWKHRNPRFDLYAE